MFDSTEITMKGLTKNEAYFSVFFLENNNSSVLLEIIHQHFRALSWQSYCWGIGFWRRKNKVVYEALEFYRLIIPVLFFLHLGSKEKREYLQTRFPQLDANSFASSRNTSFEQHVLRITNGRGKCNYHRLIRIKPHRKIESKYHLAVWD